MKYALLLLLLFSASNNAFADIYACSIEVIEEIPVETLWVDDFDAIVKKNYVRNVPRESVFSFVIHNEELIGDFTEPKYAVRLYCLSASLGACKQGLISYSLVKKYSASEFSPHTNLKLDTDCDETIYKYCPAELTLDDGSTRFEGNFRAKSLDRMPRDLFWDVKFHGWITAKTKQLTLFLEGTKLGSGQSQNRVQASWDSGAPTLNLKSSHYYKPFQVPGRDGRPIDLRFDNQLEVNCIKISP